MEENKNVLFEVQNNIAVISLNRPQQRNAIDAIAGAQLRDAIDAFENDEQLHIAILRGNGPVFCAGMDLKAFADGEAEDILFGTGRFGGLVSRDRIKPIIASVQGAALAGGFELMLACDLVVTSNSAVFGLPESKIGLVAGAGGAFKLGQILPKAIVNEILLTGDAISAERAYALGLVNKLVDESTLEQETLQWAKKISQNAPLSLRSSLRLANASHSVNEDSCWQINDLLLKELLHSDDAKEGAAAFTEKRKAVWKGQ